MAQLQWNKRAHRGTSAQQQSRCHSLPLLPPAAATQSCAGLGERVAHRLLGQLPSDHIKSGLSSVKEGWDLKNHWRSVQPFLPTYSQDAVCAPRWAGLGPAQQLLPIQAPCSSSKALFQQQQKATLQQFCCYWSQKRSELRNSRHCDLECL